MIDSVTERLLWTTDIPLLAVKRKGANTNLRQTRWGQTVWARAERNLQE